MYPAHKPQGVVQQPSHSGQPGALGGHIHHPQHSGGVNSGRGGHCSDGMAMAKPLFLAARSILSLAQPPLISSLPSSRAQQSRAGQKGCACSA